LGEISLIYLVNACVELAMDAEKITKTKQWIISEEE